MTRCLVALWVLSGLLISRTAYGQVCSEPSVCVPAEDMKVFVRLLRDEKCRLDTVPTVELDPVVIVTDRQGRVYGSGTGPRPYQVRLQYCNRTITVDSELTVTAGQVPEPWWGFRFRPKAAVTYLPLRAWATKDLMEGWDAGALVEGFYVSWLNLNGFVGLRSVGAGVGMDLTRNFGLYTGYGLAWSDLSHHVSVGLSLALWLSARS